MGDLPIRPSWRDHIALHLDNADNVYICDIMNHRIRKVDAKTKTITTFAGTGDLADTPPEASLEGTPLAGPRSIDIAPTGQMYLVLREGNRVFAIDVASRRLKLVAGTGEKGYSGDGGSAAAARFNGPKGIAYSPEGALYIADTENQVIRRIDLERGTLSTVIGTGRDGDGPDGHPRDCKLSRPHGVFVQDRLLYIGDSENHRIRTMEI